MFGAPKSLSLVAASNRRGEDIEDAHVAAVTGVLARLERDLQVHRRGSGGDRLLADGLVSAAFEHRENAAGEPHLHTHVLIANLGRADGGDWGALAGAEWYVGRVGMAALYQLELRAQLEARGWDLAWRLRPDGLADLADVPRSVVRAASTQSRTAVADGRYSARAHAAPQPWRERVAGGGHPDWAEPVGNPSTSVSEPRPDPLSDPELARRVAVWLSARRSDFRLWDAVVALASSHPGGARADQAMEWVEQFCRTNQSVPSRTARARWATPAARRADDELLMVLRARADPAMGDAVERLATSDPGAVVEELTAGAGGIHVLGAPPGRSDLLAQAEVIDRCRAAWEAAGKRVAVAVSTADAAARWGVLAGLSPHRPGERPDVLVVDRADRRTSLELIRLVAGSGSTLIFVEGGTLPRLSNPASHGLTELADGIGRHSLPEHALWVPEGPDAAARPGCPPVGRSAAQALLGEWASSERQSLLVGLGVEETRALNRAAVRLRSGRVPAPGGSDYVPGDRLVVLKGRPGLPRYGTFGTVVEIDGRIGRLPEWVRIAWDNGDTTETRDRRTLGGLGFGYAVGTHLANRSERPLMVLGPALALGRGRGRDLVVHEVPGRDVGAGLALGGGVD